jgi:ABC-type transporter Mla subunit MlaD
MTSTATNALRAQATTELNTALATLLDAYGATSDEIDQATDRLWTAIDLELDRITE